MVLEVEGGSQLQAAERKLATRTFWGFGADDFLLRALWLGEAPRSLARLRAATYCCLLSVYQP